ncbi:patatin-like phospholipase family protein [Microcoleus sp. N9_A1]|uniref:patatin-like phospholipase family protein n=1 Tax=Microcoleus sp. N9_A1 TaxID=3055380 RepID=UPI002FD571A8
MNNIRILSIDGGGIRGIIPLKVLEYIERQTGKQIHELFDVMGGTSTGGIIALGLNSKHQGEGEQSIYSAEELNKFYTEEGDKIFVKLKQQEPKQEESDENSNSEELSEAEETKSENYKAPGFDKPTYKKESIEDYLRKKFGDTKMSELDKRKDVVVSSYDIQNDSPYYFSSQKACKNPEEDYYVWQAARATSAAPTYFPAAKYSLEKSSPVFVDGGVYINNPALDLLIRAKRLSQNQNEQNFILVSLGTGNMKVLRPYLENEGIRAWMLGNPLKPKTRPPGALLEVMMKGVAEATHEQLEDLVTGNSGLKLPGLKKYYRYQKKMSENIAMDDIEKETIRKLIKLGEELVKDNQKSLDELCEDLVGK